MKASPAEEQLRRFESEILKYSAAINLVSRGDLPQLWDRHISDAVLAYEAARKAQLNVLKVVHDFGSGNGVPGVVFAILDPALKVVLVERDTRKAEFLKHCVRILGLAPRVTVFDQDVRALGSGVVNQVVCRAFAEVDLVLEHALRVGSESCELFLLKGPNWRAEFVDAELKRSFQVRDEIQYREHSFLVKFCRVPRETIEEDKARAPKGLPE